ncbi:MAG: hypothetical protein NTX22_04545 [Ignavibacteriales bacterium]|nr:hypothetical protein [Ignavibacteriales bacterium]
MKKSTLLWIFAILITIASAYYQRVTGPTYPVTGEKMVNENSIIYKLERSHSTSSNYLIKFKTVDNSIEGFLEWKRYKSNDQTIIEKMKFENGFLLAEMPAQPASGKLQYNVKLKSGNKIVLLSEQPIVIRFKGDVPGFILIPHIIFIFFAMLLSTRTGLEIFNSDPKLKIYTTWTLIFIVLGGMIFGPLTQLYAFGALWTGVPFGFDLTDNKTLIALIGWIIAAYALRKYSQPKRWIAFAALLMLVVYIIPHSVLGSELDYSKIDKQQKSLNKMI